MGLEFGSVGLGGDFDLVPLLSSPYSVSNRNDTPFV